MCLHSAGHHQPEAVGGAHLIYNGERAVGRYSNNRDKAGEKMSRMAWTPGKDTRSLFPPRYACFNGYLKHNHAEVREGGGETSGEEIS